MENIENYDGGNGKTINMTEHLTQQALIGILNRPSLEEQIKKYPSSKSIIEPTMKIVYNKNDEEILK